ncbi:MAG: NAD(P)-dependent oxidoreductase [Streptosporangiales bacterium]|nr:NAD(P)-dependent oxidoreductase [Streptosporangiales bacterium]
MSTRVGFIGLGSQGAPIARRIAGAGLPLTLWARRPESLEPFAGVKTAATPTGLAAESDVIGICVTGDADVEQVVSGPDGLLAGVAPGTVIVVHSTVHPDTCRRLAALAADRDAHLIDAPVSGGAPAADAGKLLVMAGGDESVVEKVRPVLSTFGDPVVHLGPLGAGLVTKLLNNTVFTAHLAVASSLYSLGQSFGIAPDRLGEVLGHGSGRSFALDALAHSGGTPERIGQHAGPLLRKDVALTADVAAAAGVEPGFILDVADHLLGEIGQARDGATDTTGR